jgi:soluble cytochrome b562
MSDPKGKLQTAVSAVERMRKAAQQAGQQVQAEKEKQLPATPKITELKESGAK